MNRLIRAHGRRGALLLLVLVMCIGKGFAQETESSLKPSVEAFAPVKPWRLGLSESLGLAFSEAYGMGFTQAVNKLGIDFDFAFDQTLWGGLSIAWQAAAQSPSSDEQFIIRPGWDAVSAGFALALRSQAGLLVQAELKGNFGKIIWLDFYHYYPSLGLTLAQQFELGPLMFEAGVSSEFQFRLDPGVFFLMSARLRLLF